METRMRRRRTREEDGQAILEFALVLPIFLLLVIGIIQFGIAYNNYITLTDAVRVGAREAAVSRSLPNPEQITTARVHGAAIRLNKADLTVTVIPNDPATNQQAWVQGGDVTVTGTYPYRLNLFGLVVFSKNMTSQTTERVE
jgi:Flp pilus assembly protein TadG